MSARSSAIACLLLSASMTVLVYNPATGVTEEAELLYPVDEHHAVWGTEGDAFQAPWDAVFGYR